MIALVNPSTPPDTGCRSTKPVFIRWQLILSFGENRFFIVRKLVDLWGKAHKSMTKEIIKQGFDAAEKEHQEEEVRKIKQIVQQHLEKIAFHQKEANKHQETAKFLRKDLDDLKAGRLDRIEERQEKDEKAREVRVVIVKRIEHEYLPLQPWRCPWEVISVNPSLAYGSNNTLTLSATGANTVTTLGSNFSAFTSGSYAVDGNIINL